MKLKVFINSVKLSKKAAAKLNKDFGGFEICKHGVLVTKWRELKGGAEEKYICLECYNYEQTHHGKFPKVSG